MNREQNCLEIPVALAAFRLAFHCTHALAQHGLLSTAKRQQCSEALRELHLEVEEAAMASGHPFDLLAPVRDLIAQLDDPR